MRGEVANVYSRFAALNVALFAATMAIPAVGAEPDPSVARFDYIAYEPAQISTVEKGFFRNPILPGFHPDPTITEYGDEFLLVTSTFSWMPGFPVYRSKDLVNWALASHAVTTDSGFQMDGLGVTRGMFAPAISTHKGKLYLISTCVDCRGNFVVTADSPQGPWSKPVWLDFEGIDPSIFFDSDGRAWVVNNGAPEGAPEYDGHRAIWIQEFDPAAMKMIGPRKVLVDKGVRPAEKPIWAEGPHIYREGGYYYLLAAEGGTADQHSQTIYRSRSITGPYEVGPVNPILTQRNLKSPRPDRVEATGHADFVKLADGSWWAVFLATRPYRDQFTAMGRETFLLPVKWENGWPIILADGEPVPLKAKAPFPVTQKPTAGWRDDFSTAKLSGEWIWLRTDSPASWIRHDIAKGELGLKALGVGAGALKQPAFVGQRLRHHSAGIETSVVFQPAKDGERAGLLALIDEEHFVFGGLERRAGKNMFVVRSRAGKAEPAVGKLLASFPLVRGAGSRSNPLAIRFAIDQGTMKFSYRSGKSGNWTAAGSDLDASILASVNAGLFTGTVVGPHASSAIEN